MQLLIRSVFALGGTLVLFHVRDLAVSQKSRTAQVPVPRAGPSKCGAQCKT